MKRLLAITLTVSVISLLGCGKSGDVAVKAVPKQPNPSLPTPTPTATPSPTPTATPSPTPSSTPTPTPTPTPSPTPDPLIGVWQNQSDANDIVSFAASGNGGQSSCPWTFTWATINSNTVQLENISTTNPSPPSGCKPASGPWLQERQFNFIFFDANTVQMSPTYNGSGIYVRQ